MSERFIDYLRNFIGSEWLDKEYEKIELKSPLKGIGQLFSLYHPWVNYMYEIEYLHRQATLENRDGIFMGKYHHILSDAGMLLIQNADKIIDKKDAKMRLRNPEQFYDFIWELEVRTMLTQCGASTHSINPESGDTYDGIINIRGQNIPYECKNKTLDNNRYNTNIVLSNVLAYRLGTVPSMNKKIVEIEFDEGHLEDVKNIVSTVRDNFDFHNYRSILGRYKVRVVNKIPFNTHPKILIEREGINQVFIIRFCGKGDSLTDKIQNSDVKTKILIKMPDSIYHVRNLNGILKKANTQLPPGGVVFIQVPFGTFENAKRDIENELSQSFSNISAVKIVAIDIEMVNPGVKISREEALLESPRAKIALSKDIIEFLSQPMAFSKYAN